MDAGATMLSGLSSNVSIPKVNGDLSAAFVAENSDATESDLDIDTITMTPTRVSGTSSFSREVLYTAQPDIDQMVRRILGERIALTIDDAALEGSGSGAIPTGILNTTGVNTKATAGSSTMTHAESLDVIAAVQSDNVDTAGSVWVAHPTDLATLGAQAVDSGSGRFVYDNGQIGGYRVLTSTQVTAGKLYFGRFSDLLVGMWGGTDIIVDPYTNAKKAVIAITASQMVDVNVRHPQSFNVVTLTS
jgi:HK97 family phage major capsid protein